MTILLSGASGYLGRSLSQELQFRGNKVVEIWRRPHSRTSTQKIDASLPHIELAEAIRGVGAGTLVHMANKFSTSSEEREVREMVESNLLFSIRLLEASLEAGVQNYLLVHSYWQLPAVSPSETANRSFYAQTKEAFRVYSTSRLEEFGAKVNNLFLVETFGPGDPRPKLVNLLTRESVGLIENVELKSPNLPLLLSYGPDLCSFLADICQPSSNIPKDVLYLNYPGISPQSLRALLGNLVRELPIDEPQFSVDPTMFEPEIPTYGWQHPTQLATALRITLDHL